MLNLVLWTVETMKNIMMLTEFNYIPPELLTQILVNLPVKSLMRFRCVCKSWCSIIDHPDFVSMHLKHSNVRGEKNKLLLAIDKFGNFGERGCLLTVTQTNTLKKFDRILRLSDLYWYYITGNCNGLLLVRRYDPPCYQEERRLWNPCIRKSLILPANPLPPNLIARALYMFGFAPGSNDYKVVAITAAESEGTKTRKMYVAVFTLSDQQWNIIDDDGLNIEHSYFKTLHGYQYRCFKSTAFYFQGAVHWIGDDPHGDSNLRNKSTHLVSFDFDMETFTFSELPFASYESDSSRVLFLFGESLAIFSISLVSSCIRVLENGTWTLRFSGSSGADGYKLFRSLERSKDKVFYFESDGGCLVNGQGSYNIANCQVQELMKSTSVYLELETYFESLVLCKGYGAKDMMSFP